MGVTKFKIWRNERMNNSSKSRYLLIGIVGMLFFSCFTITTSAEEETINIVCTNSFLADFTSNLITENVSIEYIMPSGVCPAFYDTTPSDVSKIVSADVVISLGSSITEPWLVDLLAYNTDCDTIECKNLGEWNIPTGAKTYVEHLTTELSEIFPELNETIKQNSEAFIAEINETAELLQNLIETNGYQDKKIIAMQWQKEFLEFLGLNVTYSYGPPQGLSTQDELDVIDAASSGEICVVVDNLQSGTDFGARVASESGASHVIFTNFPGAIPNTDTYLDMISYNTEQLINGISTFEYKKGDIAELEVEISNLELQRNVSFVLVAIFAIIAIVLFVMYRKK